ncbi:DNA polymerase III subunit epsilon [Methylopila jiangsuensis]|uniref:DNA polymerase III subunit epsilon n=1 Tax=Methylopila jiangsuensis TaxID=586230 RepID=A0A9W6JKD7_9HYPH|nr:DNA polymerase III subunit epsilon [Methylopila jiangsuensis]MDR6285265.1 DNA polymerase-3 subunit epsilon [Methylopila jiangsuensis]GLK77344.1 DNA polymerase III subunit epsilon [Methylopila jiangsuensis]
MREIVLDTETTGLDPLKGDRVVEIGCVELLNRIPTGGHYHVYINPERDMPDEAFRVHGLSAEFLSDKPVFADVIDGFLDFIAEDALVIHNAAFDVGFLNMELKRCGREELYSDRIVDTLPLARRRNPGGGASLDALCQRYGIDNSKRTKHGALLDSEILAEVYLELLGGRQASLGLSPLDALNARGRVRTPQRPVPLPPRLTAEENAAHLAFIATLGGGSPAWREYLEDPEAAAAAE